MEGKRKQTDLSIRKLIISLRCKGKSLRAIGEIVGRSHSTVQHIIDNWKYEGTLKDKPGRGRKRILSESDERLIVRKVRNNPKVSVPKLTAEVSKDINRSVSTETVRRVLRKSNLHGRVARRKPFISAVNQKKRLEFAKAYVNKPPEFWNQVIFTDETKINCFGSDGRQIVWREPNTEFKFKNLKPTVKHGGGSVLLWGCMAASGTGNLEFIDRIMDKMLYMDILKRNLNQSAQKLGLSSGYWFQQDNDPKHTAHVVREWLLYNVPKQLKTPPQSPDMNPIENLWDEIKRRLKDTNTSNKNELKKKIKETWEKIPASCTKKLVDSMPHRLQAVIDAKGGHTKY